RPRRGTDQAKGEDPAGREGGAGAVSAQAQPARGADEPVIGEFRRGEAARDAQRVADTNLAEGRLSAADAVFDFGALIGRMLTSTPPSAPSADSEDCAARNIPVAPAPRSAPPDAPAPGRMA